MPTKAQLDREIDAALELSAYAQHVRNETASSLRSSGYKKLATGNAHGEPYEIYGDETGSYTVLRSKDLSELATAYVADDGRKNYLTSVRIFDPKYKRLGIGTALYNAIEKHRGRELEPSPTHQSDEAKAFWSKRRGRSIQHATRKVATAANALHASEYAKRLTDDVYSAEEHRAAAKAHQRAAKLHKSDPAGAEAGWQHEGAASQHRQAAKARTAERKIDAQKALQKPTTWAAYQEKLAAVLDHTAMAEQYARQALIEARMRAR